MEDSGGVGIESPVTFGAVVNSDLRQAAGRFGEKVVSKRVTVPKPFDLSTSNRPASASKTSMSREDCLTFGERLAQMATKVPDRFIKRPAGEQPQLAPGPIKLKTTTPVSPNLRTEARAALKKPHFKTPLEREEECLAYMKKHQFKARRYSPDRFGISGEQGVVMKHHSDKPLTKQEPFRLSTRSRPTRNVTSEDDCKISKSKQFKARPMPDYVKSRRQAVSPADEPVGLTETEPSSLCTEERGNLEHFRLSSQIRHERAAREFRKKVRREEKEARLASKFTARPLPASTFSPAPYPQRTGVVVTQPMEISMHSSMRADERALWDRANEARIETERRGRLELEAANAAIEKKKIAKLRRLSIDHGGMAFKAKPIARGPS